MKYFLLTSAFVLCLFTLSVAQASRMPPVDKSVLDISYYPMNFPILKVQDKATEPLFARVIYSRPMKSGRMIVGDLLEYGTIWRMGANEATELELYRDATLQNTRVKKGRYTLYAIPQKDKWTIILNRETDTWGAFKYDMKKDVARAEVKPEKQSELTEALTIYFEKSSKSINLLVFWDDFKLTIPFTL